MTNPIRKVFDFKGQELRVALLLFLFFFLVIAVFQILRPLKNGLFVKTYGADIELYAKLANIAAAAAAVAAFTYLYNRVARHRLIVALTLFFVVALGAIALNLGSPGALTVWSFYLLGDLESTLMVAGFWAYLTDASDSGQAKRLFGPIGAGGVIGGWVGASTSSSLLDTLHDRGLVVLTIVLLVALVGVVLAAERLIRTTGSFREQAPPAQRLQAARSQSAAAEAVEGARLVLRSSYLAAIVGIMAFYEIASQLMDYQFKRSSQAFGTKEAVQGFMAGVYWWATMLSVVVQLFLVSLIMRHFGLVTALLVLPVSLIGASFGFLIVPSLATVSLMTIFDNGLNYSLQQTARETLYTPTSPDEKYKARAFTNMLVQRVAKGVSILGTLGLAAIGAPVHYLGIMTIVVLTLLALCGTYAGRRFNQLSAREDESRHAA